MTDLGETFVLLDALEAISSGQVVFSDDGYSRIGRLDEVRIHLDPLLEQHLVQVEPESGSFAERFVHLTSDGRDAMEMARLRVREHLRRMS